MDFRSVRNLALFILLTAPFMGCASIQTVPFGLLYHNTRSPRAYRSATPMDLAAQDSDPLVTGMSCSRAVLYLVSWGDNGYAKAVQNAVKDDPQAVLYDVRTDSRARSILLGLYQDSCTILTGRRGRVK